MSKKAESLENNSLADLVDSFSDDSDIVAPSEAKVNPEQHDGHSTHGGDQYENHLGHQEYAGLDPKNPFILDQDIPARPGFVQRWVKFQNPDGSLDWQNIQRRCGRDGWAPRDASDLKSARLKFYRSTLERFGSVILSSGHVLCEMPEARAMQRRAVLREKNQRVQQSLKSDYMGKISGIAGEYQVKIPAKYSVKSKVFVGNRDVDIKDD